VSQRVSDRAACPWRLYYTRYYTEAAISTSQSAGTPIRAPLSATGHLEYEIGAYGCAAPLVISMANVHVFSRADRVRAVENWVGRADAHAQIDLIRD
jgi:hypothetical protein